MTTTAISRFRAPLGLLLTALLAACSSQNGNGSASSGTAATSQAETVTTSAVSTTSTETTSGSANNSAASNSAASAATGGATAPELRLGLFPNVTHAAGLVGVDKDLFKKNLGSTTLAVSHFANGSQINEAFAAGALDAAYVGPGPAMNAFMQGIPLKVYAGAANAGAVLVAQSGSKAQSVKDLAGLKVAVPTRGSTQDISLRHLLHENGLKTTDEGGDVTVVPINPADMPAAFAGRQVEAALVQEPWGTVLEDQGARLLVDEKGIWANGDYTTTVLVVNSDYAEKYPGTLQALLKAHRQAVAFVKDQPDEARAAVARQVEAMTGKRPSDADLKKALGRTQVTWDINQTTLAEYAQLNQEAGFSRQVPDLNKMLDLSVVRSLNE
ncbi:ABC transporter substrate-binding protein [Deinococcus sp. Marseille-Q6407]|uniref:ABC transporter substrate-binding protein n=1 Tax=Deinococcus sp. Marseille-Q6407 TaxID=2969223 RepID=UPI0021C1637D|nr:ABC transporter substrate-binding protein [Deinococcus sp. Marseille-Q6407]